VNDANLGLVLTASFFMGTNAPGSAAVLGSPTINGDQVQFTISGTSGANYIIEVTTDLSSANWTPVSTNSAPFSFTDTNSTASSQRFYRGRSQ
jgi:hypothetical protein